MTNHFNLFIDESGKSSLIDTMYNRFILTGVIIEENEVKPIEGFFNYIKLKYNFNTSIPFHSYHVFEKKGTKLSEKDSRSLICALADFINLIPIKIKVISADKKEFREAIGAKSIDDFKHSAERIEAREFPYRIMSTKLFQWFGNNLKNKDGIGQIFVDARKGGDYEIIKTLYTCKEKSGPLKDDERELIKQKCTSICFAEKISLNGGLEITDLISWASFFFVRQKLETMKTIGIKELWRSIRFKLPDNDVEKLKKEEIQKFLKIKNGVHKCFKTSLPKT